MSTITAVSVTLHHFLTRRLVKFWIGIDDALDVFAEHGVAGMIGLLANGIFGAGYIIGLDGVNTGLYQGGWITHHWKQLYIQFTYVVAVTAYSFTVSAILAFIIDNIPGLHLRASEEAELLGMDDDQLGEFAYDYVEVRRDYLAWSKSIALISRNSLLTCMQLPQSRTSMRTATCRMETVTASRSTARCSKARSQKSNIRRMTTLTLVTLIL